jgi:hypothetical protein
VKPEERGLGFFLPALLGEPPGRVGEDEHAAENGVSRCAPMMPTTCDGSV